MPDVTIVIPNYNGIAYLGACLRSVEKQEGVSAEVLIVDNGSTDGLYSIVDIKAIVSL